MNKKLRVGVIGAGRIGRIHAEHLASRVPGATIVAVSDVIERAAEQCAADFGVPYSTADYRRLLEDPSIDAVAVCSSTDTHAQIIIDAAAAGKHIFCEKPISLDLGSIDRALEAVHRAKVTLQVGFNRRFDSNYRRTWERIRSGDIGEPHLLHIVSRDPSPPPISYVKVSGGIFLDMMIHDFDMARYLIGGEVEEVYAQAAVRVDPEIGQAGDFDTAIVMLKFENGVIGTIDNSRKAVYGYDQRVQVFGSRGMVETSNETPNTVRFSNEKAVVEDLPLRFFLERYIDSYLSEMKEFVRSVLENRPPPVTGMDARFPVEIGMAARRSVEMRRPVRIAEVR